jgi:hypothetical protein
MIPMPARDAAVHTVLRYMDALISIFIQRAITLENLQHVVSDLSWLRDLASSSFTMTIPDQYPFRVLASV